MTEGDLLRTALIIPPKGRAVVCSWASVPGVFCAPFVFWQSIVAGAGFCLLWGFLWALRTPLLWLAGCSVLVVRGPGVQLFLPGVDALQAQALAAVLMEDTP